MRLPVCIAVLLVIAGFARADTAVGPFQDCEGPTKHVTVESDAMLPTYRKGDRLVANCFTHAIRGSSLVAGQVRLGSLIPQLSPGDLVVFRRPDDTSKTSIRRVVAFPGDKVQLRDYRLVVNDTLLPTTRVGDYDIIDSQGDRKSVVRLHETVMRHVFGYDILVPHELTGGGGASDPIQVPPQFILVFPDNRATARNIDRPGLRLVPLVNLIGRINVSRLE